MAPAGLDGTARMGRIAQSHPIGYLPQGCPIRSRGEGDYPPMDTGHSLGHHLRPPTRRLGEGRRRRRRHPRRNGHIVIQMSASTAAAANMTTILTPSVIAVRNGPPSSAITTRLRWRVTSCA
uniref:Uncharacterized protein n=1 Tax=Plectus sambesii TaxID=2011161 RepID=A0A914VCW3_9BILA